MVLIMEEIFENLVARNEISCTKGCSYCCHTQVSVTQDEAELLATNALRIGDIDVQNLYIQAQTKNFHEDWNLLDYDQRRCIFLDDNDLCLAYVDRPSVCRTNYSFSEPEQCSTENGASRPMQILRTEKADVAAFDESNENGALPYMLWKALLKLQEKNVNEENQVLNNPLLLLKK